MLSIRSKREKFIKFVKHRILFGFFQSYQKMLIIRDLS